MADEEEAPDLSAVAAGGTYGKSSDSDDECFAAFLEGLKAPSPAPAAAAVAPTAGRDIVEGGAKILKLAGEALTPRKAEEEGTPNTALNQPQPRDMPLPPADPASLWPAEREEDTKDEDPVNGISLIEIPNDSFSMFYAANDWLDHVLPACVFVLQILILVLIAYNLLEENGRPLANPLNYIACFVSVFTADDFISGMLHVHKRIVWADYSPLSDGGNGGLPPTSWKWELSNGMRMLEGALVIFVSFIFIVQSSTAIDLFLNFAGVAFVGFLDDTAFLLSRNGFLGLRATRLAQRVSDLRAYDHFRGQSVGMMEVGRYVLFALITVAMWAGLSVFVFLQDDMHFSCRRIAVEMGETKYSWTCHLSGSYSRANGIRIGQRVVYVKDEGVRAFIAYCHDKRWIVDYMNSNESLEEIGCSDTWALMSERTRTFDISEVGEFRFWTGEASGLEVQCTDCNPKHSSESCSFSGYCNKETRACICEEGNFGARCQNKGPCTEMVMHESFENSRFKSFDLVYHGNNEPLMWLGLPVYSQEQTSRYMFYDGGHWNVIESDLNSTSDIVKYLGVEVTHNALYVSEPSNSGSPANLAFRAKLANVEQYWDDDVFVGTTLVGRLSDKEFHFSCADCLRENDDGTSLQDGKGIAFCTGSDGRISHDLCVAKDSTLHGTVNRCSCEPGFMGPLCHIRPAEGKLILHLDEDGSGFCPVCGGEANDWSFRKLDGIRTTCIPFPEKPLAFRGTNGTFTRQLGLNLNMTHFTVFVSGNSAVSGDDYESELCSPKAGVKEIYSLKRNSSKEQIQHDYAIQLKNDNNYFGEAVDPAGIECKTKTNVDKNVCDAVGPLTFAWIQLDMKVTPVQ